MIIPPWLKIVGPLVVAALLIAGVMAWGSSKFKAGKEEGVAETHAVYKAASDKLKADAEASATQADDKAAERFDEHLADAKADQEAVNEALQNGTSPLDALFGG